MGVLPTRGTIFPALGKLRARGLPEAAAAARAGQVSAARGAHGPARPGRRGRRVAAPGVEGAPRAQTLLFPPRTASLAPSLPQPHAATCKERFPAPPPGAAGRARCGGRSAQTPEWDEQRERERPFQGGGLRPPAPHPGVGVGREELASPHFQPALRGLQKGAGSPILHGEPRSPGPEDGDSAGFANRLTEVPFSVALTANLGVGG